MSSENLNFGSYFTLAQCSRAITPKVCLHLTLGKCPCNSTTVDETQLFDSSTRKRKLVQQAINDGKKKINNDEKRKLGYSLDDSWEIKKVLEESDLGNNCRLLLNKKLVEDFMLPHLGSNAEKEIEVGIFDVDTGSLHTLKLIKYLSSQSYIFKSGWIKKFVLRRDLKKGDEIGLHWNEYKKHFNFTVVYGDRH